MAAIRTGDEQADDVEQVDEDAGALLLRIPDAARLLGVGRTTLYKLIDDGEIHVLHIGRAVRISMGELHDFVARQRGDRS